MIMPIMKWLRQLGSWTFGPQLATGWTAAVPKAEGGSREDPENHIEAATPPATCLLNVP